MGTNISQGIPVSGIYSASDNTLITDRRRTITLFNGCGCSFNFRDVFNKRIWIDLLLFVVFPCIWNRFRLAVTKKAPGHCNQHACGSLGQNRKAPVWKIAFDCKRGFKLCRDQRKRHWLHRLVIGKVIDPYRSGLTYPPRSSACLTQCKYRVSGLKEYNRRKLDEVKACFYQVRVANHKIIRAPLHFQLDPFLSFFGRNRWTPKNERLKALFFNSLAKIGNQVSGPCMFKQDKTLSPLGGFHLKYVQKFHLFGK